MRILEPGESLKMGRVAERLRIAAGKLEGIPGKFKIVAGKVENAKNSANMKNLEN